MTDEDAVTTIRDGWDLLFGQARIIAMLPLEDWLKALSLAETMGPIIDPTLYREYLYSEKGEVIKSIIEAAIPLKRAVLKAQKAAAALPPA